MADRNPNNNQPQEDELIERLTEITALAFMKEFHASIKDGDELDVILSMALSSVNDNIIKSFLASYATTNSFTGEKVNQGDGNIDPKTYSLFFGFVTGISMFSQEGFDMESFNRGIKQAATFCEETDVRVVSIRVT